MSQLINFIIRFHRFLGLSFYDSSNVTSDSHLLYIWPTFIFITNFVTICSYLLWFPPFSKFDSSGMLFDLVQVGGDIHGILITLECILLKPFMRDLFLEMRELRMKFKRCGMQQNFEIKLKNAFLVHLIETVVILLRTTFELVYTYFCNTSDFVLKLQLMFQSVLLAVRVLQVPLLMKIVKVCLETCSDIILSYEFTNDLCFLRELQRIFNKIYKINFMINKFLGTTLFFSPFTLLCTVIVFLYIFFLFALTPNTRTNLDDFVIPQAIFQFFIILYMVSRILLGSVECKKMVRR